MKNTSKILALVLALVMMFAIASMLTVSAAEQPEYLYLTPNANWKKDGARFAAYFFDNGETWVSMTDTNGDGIYEVKVPTDKVYPKVIFCRMNPNASANNWNNKWNQTADLTIPTSGANHYTVKEGTWDSGGGTWSTYGSTCLHTDLGPEATCTTPQLCNDCGDPVVSALGHAYTEAHVCTRCSVQATFTVAGSGAHLGTEWDTGNTANDMTYADGVYTKVYTNVAAGTYEFKVARDHDWGTAYPGANKSFKVDTAGSTVTITLTGTTVDVVVVAPHTHVWSDATCTEPKRCECGETEGEALGHDMVTDAAKAPTCTETGLTEGSHCSRCDAATTAQEVVPVIDHSYVEGVCSACGATDPDYVAPLPEGTYVFESSKLDAAAAGDFADGTVVKVDDYFSLILGAKSKIDSSSKTWKEEDWGELAYKSGQRLYLGGKTSTTANAIVFTTSKAATVTVWWVSNGEPNEDGTGSRPIGILDSEGNILAQDTTGVAKNALYISTFEIPAAGTYYLGNMVDNNYFFKVEVVEKDVEAPHVNTLVVGETNKIVIDSDQDNGYGYYIELVAFAVEEAGYYTFAGEGVTIWIYDANNALVSMTGAANLEPGYYGIFIAANKKETTGEYNVAVTKAAWVNALVEGATSKINITDALNNGAGYYITWVEFKVTEAGHYAFTGTDAVAWIFSSDYQTLLCGMSGAADLQPGTYQICVAPLATNTTGMFNITVTKTEITTGGGDDVDPPVDNPTHDGEQVFVVGENKVVIDGCTLNLVQQAVEMVKFEVTEKAKYTFVSDINTYISTSSDPADLTGYLGGAFVEEGILEPGTYYICCGNSGAKGEFTVTVVKEELDENCEHEWIPANCGTPKTCSKCAETEGEPNPEVHVTFADTCLLCGKDVPSFKVGDNNVVYVPGAANLMANGDLYGKFEITEPGTYVITGGAAEMIKVYVWSIPTSGLEGGQLTMDTPYAVNIDVMTETGLANSFEITLSEAGVYWIGFAFDLRGEGHEGCEFGVNISLKEEEEHVHEFVEGKCECGEEDPNYTAPTEPKPEEPVELNFFQKIVKLIKDLLAKFLGFFKRFGL